ncbi:MAG TPA: glycosyltransferase family 1 protein [Candidatus Woesebacteria bacterium]|nr:glycosyltransferase family 1 protein [Candidatus Woesebacteria bacterium]
MKIGFDVTSLIYQRGVSRYTANLIRALGKVSGVELAYYGSSFGKKQLLSHLVDQTLPEPLVESIQALPVGVVNQLWRFGFNQIAHQLPGIEIFHGWEWQLPPDKNIPLIVTIHDLAMLHFPETAHPKALAAHQRVWRRLAESGAHVIAVSRATRADVINLLQIPPYRVHLVHEALPTELTQRTAKLSEADLLQTKAKLGLDQKPFLLFVGTREPRKNLARLIAAWQMFAPYVDLVVVGEVGWENKPTAEYQHQPKYLGRVNDQVLSILYTEAAAFVYPSLFEGFGLPILEAFHHWCPVVTSNSSAMVEVAGNAAVLIDPESVESIQAGIELVLNESEAEQAVRTQRMVIRLQLFDWQTTAEKTLLAYQTCIDHFYTDQHG